MNGNEIVETSIHHNGTCADVILRSTDNVDFHTSKVLLSKTSELFQTLFSIPQPPAESDDQEFIDGSPVIPIDADASLLRNLLLFCNPEPEMVRLHEVQRLATKYQMYEVVKRILRERTRGKVDLIPPIMLATIKESTGPNNDAYISAVSIVLFPEDNLTEDVVELGLLTKAQADSLLAYRKECVEAARGVASPAHNRCTWMSEVWARKNWFKDDRGEHGRGNCNEGGNIYIGNTQGKWMTRRWWRDYMYKAKEELEKRPCGLVVQGGGEIFERALREGSQCGKCAPGLDSEFREFAALFASEVDKAVSAVSEHDY
jgi:hypothetical protein